MIIKQDGRIVVQIVYNDIVATFEVERRGNDILTFAGSGQQANMSPDSAFTSAANRSRTVLASSSIAPRLMGSLALRVQSDSSIDDRLREGAI